MNGKANRGKKKKGALVTPTKTSYQPVPKVLFCSAMAVPVGKSRQLEFPTRINYGSVVVVSYAMQIVKMLFSTLRLLECIHLGLS